MTSQVTALVTLNVEPVIAQNGDEVEKVRDPVPLPPELDRLILTPYSPVALLTVIAA